MSLILRNEFFKYTYCIQRSFTFDLYYSINSHKQFDFNKFKPYVSIVQGPQILEDVNEGSLIFPTPFYFEGRSTYVDIFGRFNIAQKLAPTLGVARNNWQLLDVFNNILFTQFTQCSFQNHHESDNLVDPSKLASSEASTLISTFSPIKGRLGEKKKQFCDFNLKLHVKKDLYCFFLSPYVNYFDTIYNSDTLSALSKNIAIISALENQQKEL